MIEAIIHYHDSTLIEDGYDDPFTVGSSFLRDYAWAIEDAIEKDRRLDDQDMAQYFHEDSGLKNKLASMVWGVEVYRGELFGKMNNTTSFAS